jgi:hypothetical protein
MILAMGSFRPQQAQAQLYIFFWVLWHAEIATSPDNRETDARLLCACPVKVKNQVVGMKPCSSNLLLNEKA